VALLLRKMAAQGLRLRSGADGPAGPDAAVGVAELSSSVIAEGRRGGREIVISVDGGNATVTLAPAADAADSAAAAGGSGGGGSGGGGAPSLCEELLGVACAAAAADPAGVLAWLEGADVAAASTQLTGESDAEECAGLVRQHAQLMLQFAHARGVGHAAAE
jgi:hypothetical protein